jgi:ABC-type glutathione transport system ATPase component
MLLKFCSAPDNRRLTSMQDSNAQPVPTDHPILRNEYLGRKISAKILVKDVSFSLMCADILAVVGPSCSGKRSLLRLLNRLDQPTWTASIEIDPPSTPSTG